MTLEFSAGQDTEVRFDARGVVWLELVRPAVRNAMSFRMVEEIEAVFDTAEQRSDVRVVVLRGRGGHFCAGGDVKDMARVRASTSGSAAAAAMAAANRRFGTLIEKVDRASPAVVAVLEGSVLGGGLGLACVADVALALADASFGLPEAALGLPPAQIAPFLVRRLGLSNARRLAVTAARFDGRAAAALGLCHEVIDDAGALEPALEATLARILRCAPGAVAATKRLMNSVGELELGPLLDRGAEAFAAAALGEEGIEGMTSFLQKRPPRWAVSGTQS